MMITMMMVMVMMNLVAHMYKVIELAPGGGTPKGWSPPPGLLDGKRLVAFSLEFFLIERIICRSF